MGTSRIARLTGLEDPEVSVMAAVPEDPAPTAFVDALLALGFSQYEARCYVGLTSGAQTGYAVAKTTGVPQPKVYEVLRKLVARGAARQLPGEPARFVAIPPADLLDDLGSSFEQRLESARTASTRLQPVASAPEHEPVVRLHDRGAVIEAAAGLLRGASRRVYLSATSAELRDLREAVESAAAAGMDVVVLAFGRMPFSAPGVRAFRHASTDGAVFGHHQSRHLAIVADSHLTVFGLAADGERWSGISTDNGLVTAAVKGYIRHDLDLQRVFADFRPQLLEAYGPGLQRLEDYRADPADGDLGPSDRPAPVDEQDVRAG